MYYQAKKLNRSPAPALRRAFNYALIILLLAVAWTIMFHLDWVVAGLPKAGATAISDKADADCTGQETAGRCADKCPAPQFQRGIDKKTGAAVCGTVTGCPYGDSIPLDSPKCAPPSTSVYNAIEPSTPADAEPFIGK